MKTSARRDYPNLRIAEIRYWLTPAGPPLLGVQFNEDGPIFDLDGKRIRGALHHWEETGRCVITITGDCQ